MGEGDNRLSFPGSFLVKDALNSPGWVRFSTPDQLAADPTKTVRLLEADRKPHYLIHADGSIAYEYQCIGLKGDTVQAVVDVNYVPQPVINVQRHVTSSEGDEDDGHGPVFGVERTVVNIGPYMPKPPLPKPWDTVAKKNDISN